MQGVGHRRIDFGAKADQTGSLRRGQLENPNEPRRRHQQADTVVGLGAGFADTGRIGVAKRLQKQPGLGVAGVFGVIAEQP